MFDRILLILLILLLPIGIFASRFVTGELKIGTGLSPEQEKKVDLLVAMLNQQNAQAKNPANTIIVTAAVYASESGSVKLTGIAPKPQAFIWVWVAGSKAKEEKKPAASLAAETVNPVWSGPQVLWPREGGAFTAEVDISKMAGMAEVRLEQESSVANIKYDVDKKLMLP